MTKKYKKLKAYPKVNDLTGLEVNQLKVLYLDEEKTKELQKDKTNNLAYWFCSCSCGNLTSIRSNRLTVKNRLAISCGCHMKGKVFTYLTVIEPVKNTDQRKWLCQCKCDGKIIAVCGIKLRAGTTRSCGCYQKEKAHLTHFKDLSKQRFGMLQVIDRNFEYQKVKKSKQTYWNCICDCKNITIVTGGKLKNGSTFSCGCIKSRGELEIKILLTINDISYKQEYMFNDCLSYTDNPLRFDFAIVNEKYDAKYLIEFDGEQHFKEPKINKKEVIDTENKLNKKEVIPTENKWSNFTTRRRHDNIKNNYCFNNNIPLIRIPYTALGTIVLEDLIPETSKYLITPNNVEAYYKKYDKQ